MSSHHSISKLLALLLALALLALPPVAQPAALDPALLAALSERLERLAGPGSSPTVAVVRAAESWIFGTLARPALDAHAAPLAYLFLAEPAGDTWAVTLDGEPDFAKMLRRAPDRLITSTERAALGGAALAAFGEALLGLPFGVGEGWYFTGGPHPSGFDGSGAWSALDFAGGSGVVRAAREGVAYVPCPNFVKIYHADGFQTGYYHLEAIQVVNGQPVERGAALGRISSAVGCGGQAHGDHVHFWLMHGGDLPINGVALGGWTVQNGAAAYQGCMVRPVARLCAGAGRIFNDGAIGDEPAPALALANPSFEASDGPAPWQPNGPCAVVAPAEPQQAQDGARYLAASNSRGSGCVSILQQIDAPPEPGTTYRLAIWARSGDDVPRQATLALWALGPTPRPAAVALTLNDRRWRCYEVALPPDGAIYSGLRAELYLHTGDAGPYHFDAAALGHSEAPICPAAERYRATVVGLEYPATLDPGATGTISLTLRNSGATAWDAATMLAPLPRDNPPALAETGWPMGGARIVAVPGVAPGEERTISFAVRAPDRPGIYSFSLGLVQEALTWFAEPGDGAAAVIITVGNPSTGEPPGPERLFLPQIQ